MEVEGFFFFPALNVPQVNKRCDIGTMIYLTINPNTMTQNQRGEDVAALIFIIIVLYYGF